VRSREKAPVGGLGIHFTEAAGSMHINAIFCLKYVRTHNTVSRAKIAQSTQLSQQVKQCVLATLKRDELVFWTPHFSFLDSTLFHFDSTFLVGLHA